MRSTFSKPFDEEFARLCIEQCFPELGWDMELCESDPPDIIVKNHSIGIEVRRSTNKLNGQLSGELATNIGKKKNEIKPGVLKKIDRDRYGVIYDNESPDAVVIGATYPVCSSLYDEICNALVKKTERMNNGKYPAFEKDAIFIINSGGFCFDEGLRAEIEELYKKLIDYERVFTIIFVYCDNELFYYNNDCGKVIKKELSNETIEELRKNALYNIGRKEEYHNKEDFIGNDKIDNTA